MRSFSPLLALGGAACALAANCNSSSSSSSTYDYIVVGGGPAGIIAATRLAQSNKSVLLLEKGVGPTVETGSHSTLAWDADLTAVDVPGLSTVASNSAYMCADVPAPAACVLGGGPTINYMVFVHPAAHDFDDKWPRGWKWADVAPAAERLYAVNNGSSTPSADGRRYDQAMYDVVAAFFASLGWSAVDSAATPDAKFQAYSHPHWNIEDQLRAGPLRTYLPLAQELPNFTLRTNATVRRVVRTGGTATGVEVKFTGVNGTVIETISLNPHGGGGVVLAAGAWNTPRILIQSGIGPAAQIAVVRNGTTGIALPPRREWIELPAVGRNFKDHPIYALTVQTPANFTIFNASAALSGADAADVALYESAESGPLAQGYHRMVWWTSAVGAADNVTRYYQGSTAPASTAGVSGQFGVKLYQTHGLRSEGAMGIAADGSAVLLESMYNAEAADVAAATDMIEELVARFTAYGWDMVGYTNASAVVAAPSKGDHFVGSAVIGTDPATSVVGTDVRVHGTENIFVVDSSIHADLPTGNTQAIVMVVAEAAVAKIIARQH